jgi:hypothetical protein
MYPLPGFGEGGGGVGANQTKGTCVTAFVYTHSTIITFRLQVTSTFIYKSASFSGHIKYRPTQNSNLFGRKGAHLAMVANSLLVTRVTKSAHVSFFHF